VIDGSRDQLAPTRTSFQRSAEHAEKILLAKNMI